jgi:hypothetical protein
MRFYPILLTGLLFFICTTINGHYINFQETIGGNDWESMVMHSGSQPTAVRLSVGYHGAVLPVQMEMMPIW